MDPSKGRPGEKKREEISREELDRRQSARLPTICSGLLLGEDPNDSISEGDSNDGLDYSNQKLRASPAVTDLTAPVEDSPPRRKHATAATVSQEPPMLMEIVHGISALDIDDQPFRPGPSNLPDTVALTSLHRRLAVTDLTRALSSAPDADDASNTTGSDTAEEVITAPTDSAPTIIGFSTIPENKHDIVEVADEPDVVEVANEPDIVEVADEPDVVEVANEPDIVELADEPDIVELADEPDVLEVANEPDIVEVVKEPNNEEVANEPDNLETANNVE